MIWPSPNCAEAQRLELPEHVAENWDLPDRPTKQRTVFHVRGCAECSAHTGVQLGHLETAMAVRHESRSRPGQFYITTAHGCSCPGFGYRGRCYHNDELKEKAVFV